MDSLLLTFLIHNTNNFYYTDINECDWNNGNCSQICNNIQGSYYCSCQAGYWLSDDDKMTCYGKNKIFSYECTDQCYTIIC